ncbi:MAG TPA: TldD/PmbA family protein, partial [Aggregatilineales bacterium]|nr:TldD/PmbA family protein [Aggregatilineales bacterium]
ADLAQYVERCRVRVTVFVAGPSGVRTHSITKQSALGMEAMSFSDEELQTTVDTAIALLGAERVEPGEYTIVSAPGVSGTICHESFGHGVETDMFLKERALAAHFIDKVVASPLVNIYDDPSQPDQWGSYFFDDEGMLSRPTQIVENGTFRRGITDLYSATALGIERSANGRRQDYTRKAYARMSNTYFGAGETPLADVFQQVDQGIYLEQWTSGMEDPKGWGIQVTCSYGHEIKHGRVTDRIFGPIAISGYVPEVLQSISAVSNDWALESGVCGKGHKEIVPVTSGGPHLLLKARLG